MRVCLCIHSFICHGLHCLIHAYVCVIQSHGNLVCVFVFNRCFAIIRVCKCMLACTHLSFPPDTMPSVFVFLHSSAIVDICPSTLACIHLFLCMKPFHSCVFECVSSHFFVIICINPCMSLSVQFKIVETLCVCVCLYPLIILQMFAFLHACLYAPICLFVLKQYFLVAVCVSTQSFVIICTNPSMSLLVLLKTIEKYMYVCVCVFVPARSSVMICIHPSMLVCTHLGFF